VKYHRGQHVLFRPKRGNVMQAVVVAPSSKGRVEIRIAKDPFSVQVEKSQVSPCDQNGKPLKSNQKANKGHEKETTSTMTTDTKPSARELRNEAKALGVEDYDEMSRKELVAAIKAAKKSAKGGKTKAKTSKKAKVEKVSAAEAVEYAKDRAAKKAKGKKGSAAKATAKAKPAKASSKPTKAAKATKAAKTTKGGSSKASSNGHGDGTNPFRKGSNLHIMCGLLLKGGKRETLAEKLSEKTDLHPYSGNEVTLADFDKRLLLAAQTLRDKHGFKVERSGRGLEGKIKVVPGGKRKG
jgi:hypothetical protein